MAENTENEFLEEEGALDISFTNERFKLEEEKYQPYSKVNYLEIYKIVIDTRKFEIENFWKRATFFWGTIAILFYAYYSIKIETKYLCVVSLTGLVYGLIFSISTRGSKYWQEHWELLAREYEGKLNDIYLFRWQLIKKIHLKTNDNLMLLKPRRVSVSKLVMIISDFLVFSWLILFIKDIYYLHTIGELSLNFFNSAKPSHYSNLAIAIISITVFVFGYIVIFLKRTIDENKQDIEN